MDRSPPLIRTLTVADASAYREIRLRGLRDEPDAFGTSADEEAARPLDLTIERLRRQEASGEDFTLGAFDGTGALLGIAMFSRFAREKERHKGAITGVYVVPEARGIGLGRALVADAVARARRQPGLVQIQIVVVTRKTIA